MATVAVKCPVCSRVKVLRRRAEQRTWYCCGMRHLVEQCLICESVGLRKASKPEKKELKQTPLMLEVDGQEYEVEL